MPDIESLLNRWQSAGVVDAATASRIRAYESASAPVATAEAKLPAQAARMTGASWQAIVALILGGILLACGVVLFVSAHWDELGPGARYTVVMLMVTIFHVGGAMAREKYRGLSTALHAVGTVSTGAAIALVGQIFNIQEHWPAAILLWGIAALAGWALLQDQAQEILTLLLLPAWILCEFSYAAESHIGDDVYIGRFLIAWGMLYLTVFLGSERKVVRGVLFAVAAIAALTGVVLLLESWRSSWDGRETYLALHTRVWGWIDIAAIPLLCSLFRLRKSLAPVVVAIAFGIALPWCNHTWREYYNYAYGRGSYVHSEPNLAAYPVVALFSIFIIWWGMREASKALVNFGIVGFAITVVWFYFSDIFDKVGRSLGLIGVGILFLAGGWALEKTRRGLLTHMSEAHAQEAVQ
ncbi:MAG TPA: DUF2157 domain-containing protein [Terracidiphilus sp.]|nr:DUF2157 domain-containing protein [Terracidiphilus sp.]